MSKTYTIGIIGTGASGVAVFVHLVQKMIRNLSGKDKLSIMLAEKKDNMGAGLAFGTGQEGHLLNTKAGMMGIYAEEPMHFVHWMHRHKDWIAREFPQSALHPDAYPPRMLYGHYLQDCFQRHLALAEQHHIRIDCIKEDVNDMDITKDGCKIRFASGKKAIAHLVVLATGNPKSATFKKLSDCEKYFDSPWPSSRILNSITQKDAHVCLIGSSLTALDGIKTLVDNGHEGPITLFSRKGLMPRVQAPQEMPFDRKVLRLENIRRLMRKEHRPLRIKDLIRLFRAEVESSLGKKLVWRDFERAGRSQPVLLKHDIEKALSGQSIFQDILYATRHDSYTIWKLLAPDQQLLYGKWIKAEVDINRHAMPLENGIKILHLLESGQLNVKSESETIEYDIQRRLFVMKMKDGEDFTADYVINATGPATQLADMEDIPLIQKLLEKQLLLPYTVGGADADLHTMRLKTPALAESPIYGIGHLLNGLQLDINALWFNVARADDLTDDLIKRIEKWTS